MRSAEELGLTQAFKTDSSGQRGNFRIRRALKPALKVTAEMAIHIVVPAETLKLSQNR